MARQLHGAARHSVLDRRRHYRAFCLRSEFLDLCGDRLRIVVRRVGDEWHPDHLVLQSDSRRWTQYYRSHGEGDRAADAADHDDGAVGLHRIVPGRDLERYWQPGAAPA